MNTTPYITTQRTYIRLATTDDIPSIIHYYQSNKDHLTKFADLAPHYFDQEFWVNEINRRHQEAADDISCKLFAFSNETNQIIGIANYFSFIRGAFQGCILGFSLAESHVGQGLMQEILSATNQYVFTTLNMHRIMANFFPDNVKSQKTLKQLSFHEEGYAKDYLYFHGKWNDHILTSLTNPEWSI